MCSPVDSCHGGVVPLVALLDVFFQLGRSDEFSDFGSVFGRNGGLVHFELDRAVRHWRNNIGVAGGSMVVLVVVGESISVNIELCTKGKGGVGSVIVLMALDVVDLWSDWEFDECVANFVDDVPFGGEGFGRSCW